ncbi:MAG: hypothetical protein O3A36_02000 [bacterium]|nr:hypothetical protein [bacterium]
MGLGLAVLLLAAMALQYPLSATFPIGPDAPAHIRDALKLTKEYPGDASGIKILLRSPYPLSVAMLSATRILPISWPERFTWWITMGHIAVGLMIGLFVYRIHDWQAAAIAISMWAPLTVTLNNHFESGTLPQLWSLAFLLLFFERVAARSIAGSVTTFLLVLISHPITAVLVVLSATVSLPILFIYKSKLLLQEQRQTKILLGSLIIIYITSIVAFLHRYSSTTYWSGPHFPFHDIVTSPLSILLLLSIVGLIAMQKYLRKNIPLQVLFNSFQIITILLALNNLFGVDIWTYRFRSSVIVIMCISAAIALQALTSIVFTRKTTRVLFISSIIGIIALYAWQHNASVYARYEADDKYRRIHPDEKGASIWMKNHIPRDSFIVSTNVNRFSEWIPLYSNIRWEEIGASHPLFNATNVELAGYVPKTAYTHIIFFLRREQIPVNIQSNPQMFENIHTNDGAIVYKILQ